MPNKGAGGTVMSAIVPSSCGPRPAAHVSTENTPSMLFRGLSERRASSGFVAHSSTPRAAPDPSPAASWRYGPRGRRTAAARAEQGAVMRPIARPGQAAVVPDAPQVHHHDQRVRVRRLAPTRLTHPACSPIHGGTHRQPNVTVHACLLSSQHTKWSKHGLLNEMARILTPWRAIV